MVTPADFEREWRTGDRGRAREMAREYVQSDRDRLEVVTREAIRALRSESLDAPATRDELVRLVDRYRELGDDESRLLLEMLLLADYPPQEIIGEVHITGSAADAMAAVFAAEAIMGGSR
jgi:hypothetical protein